jgi:DNA-binding CsgD family transcriptional regulator
MVGRVHEIGVLADAIAAARQGHGRVVVIEGEPGIGKTRLLDEVVARSRDDGFTVCRAACDDLTLARPFAALIAALGIDGDESDPDRAALSALVHESDAAAAALESRVSPGLEHRLIAAIGALVERLATRAPLLLAVDDLQWADVSTLAALRSIGRRAATLPMALVVSCRSGDGEPALNRATDDLLRAGGTLLAVGSLDDASVAALVTDVLDAEPSDVVLERVRGASGNPLFVIEYVRSIDRSEEPSDSTPVAFRSTVLRRLAALPETTQDALRVASLLGASFAPADLATACGTSVVELTRTLQPAIAGAILEDRPPVVSFRHALIRDAVYEHIPLSMRRELHREIARALAESSGDARTVAHHLGLAAAGEDPEAAAWMRRAASDVAQASPAVAVELLERARDLLPITSPLRVEVLADLALALAWSGRLAEAESLSRDVLARAADPAIAGAVRCGLVYALTWQGRPVEALGYATREADERLSESDATLLLAQTAVAHMWTFNLQAAASIAADAAAQAQRLGHELALCHALTVQSLVATFAGTPHDAVTLARRAVELADASSGGAAQLAHPRFFPGMPLLFLDRIDEAEETLQTGLGLAERLGLAWSEPLYHAFLAAKGFIVGDWDGAIAECDAALTVADDVGLHVGIIAAVSAWLATIQVHRDDIAGAQQTLGRALERLAETGPQLGMGPFNCARALVLEAEGHVDEAVALLQHAWDLFSAGAPPSAAGGARVMTDPWSAMALVRLCVATGDLPRAAALLPSIDHQSEATGTPFMRGQALRCRGLVEQDADTLVRAVALYRQCPRPHELASACEDAALALAAAGRVDEARPLWDDAVDLYEGLGADRDTARVRAELRRHGVRRGTRRPNVRAKVGWESLTDTELRVVALVASGLSNPDVAERLFISRYTVESHLKSVYRKLGISSRVELAAIASRHDRPG